NVFGEHRRRERQYVNQPQRAAGALRHRHCDRDRGFGMVGIGEVDRYQDLLEHDDVLIPSRTLTISPQSASARNRRGVMKRSSRPLRGCSLLQSPPTKSITSKPEVGRPSLSRSRASTSPEAISSLPSSCSPGLCPTTSSTLAPPAPSRTSSRMAS